MGVRQALNAVYARVVSGMEPADRKKFVDSLYGWDELNQRGTDVLRDIRGIDDVLTGADDAPGEPDTT
jgi:hypothetical protein